MLAVLARLTNVLQKKHTHRKHKQGICCTTVTLELVGASGAAMKVFFWDLKFLSGVFLAGGSWATCVHVGRVGVVSAMPTS